MRSATPETKSVAWSSTFDPWSPEVLPESAAAAEIVTLSSEASKVFSVFPYASSAVRVLAPVNAAPFVCGLVSCTANFASAAGETATPRRSAPDVVMAVLPEPPSPAEAVTFALPAA